MINYWLDAVSHRGFHFKFKNKPW